ncbi:MAG: hypothetical protein R3F49_01650 [Planctomycetota bacterium]
MGMVSGVVVLTLVGWVALNERAGAPAEAAGPHARGNANWSSGGEGAGSALGRWRSQRFAPSEAPDALPRPARATLAALAPLVQERGYRVDVSECGRVVLVSDTAHCTVRGAETALKRALAAFDARFPGAGPGRTAVLVRARNDRDADDFITQLAADDDDALDAGRFATVSAWVQPRETARPLDEGRLASAAAGALLWDRYGALPEWFEAGVRLHIEAEATGRFASVDDDATPRAWRSALKRRYKRHDEARLDLVALGPGRVDGRSDEGPGTHTGERAPGRAHTGGGAPGATSAADQVNPWRASEQWALVDALAHGAGAAGLGPLATELGQTVADPATGSSGPIGRRGLEQAAAAQGRALDAHGGPRLLTRVGEALAQGRAFTGTERR